MNVKNQNQNEVSSGKKNRKLTKRERFLQEEWPAILAWKRKQVKEREIDEYRWNTLLSTAKAVTKIKGEENAFYYTEMKPHLEFLETLERVCERLTNEFLDQATDAEKREEIRGMAYSILISKDFCKELIKRFA